MQGTRHGAGNPRCRGRLLHAEGEARTARRDRSRAGRFAGRWTWKKSPARLRIAVGGDDRASRWQDPVWGDVYDVELRLVGVDRGSPEAISQLYVRTKSAPPATATQTAVTSDGQREAIAAGPDAAGQRRPPVRREPVRTHRSLGPSADGGGAGQHRAGLRPERPHPGGPGGGARAGHAAGLRHARLGPRTRTGTDAGRVSLDVRAVVHLHVLAAGGAVRAHRPPADHSVLAAPGGPVRTGQPVAGRRIVERVLGPGHPGPVRRGQEGLDPASRSHEPAAGRRVGPRGRRSCKATATACGRS